MTKKIADKRVEENYEYTGLGFPIHLKNVEFKSFYGEYQPVIDIKKVSDLAIRKLASQEKEFTGSELYFIRSYLHKSAEDFAAAIQSSTQNVSAWETLDNKYVTMPKNVKDNIQEYVQTQLKQDSLLDNKKKPLLSEINLFTPADKKTPDAIPDTNKPVLNRKK